MLSTLICDILFFWIWCCFEVRKFYLMWKFNILEVSSKRFSLSILCSFSLGNLGSLTQKIQINALIQYLNNWYFKIFQLLFYHSKFQMTESDSLLKSNMMVTVNIMTCVQSHESIMAMVGLLILRSKSKCINYW